MGGVLHGERGSHASLAAGAFREGELLGHSSASCWISSRSSTCFLSSFVGLVHSGRSTSSSRSSPRRFFSDAGSVDFLALRERYSSFMSSTFFESRVVSPKAGLRSSWWRRSLFGAPGYGSSIGRAALPVLASQEEELALAGLLGRQRRVRGGEDLEVGELPVEELPQTRCQTGWRCRSISSIRSSPLADSGDL